jgi:plasmid stabilization system protein ParE
MEQDQHRLLIALFPEADAQVRALEQFYVEKQRPQAPRNLGDALAEANLIIKNAPERGLPAPRPYPALAMLGLSGLKRGRYWITYDAGMPIIADVFFETDDVPNRV